MLPRCLALVLVRVMRMRWMGAASPSSAPCLAPPTRSAGLTSASKFGSEGVRGNAGARARGSRAVPGAAALGRPGLPAAAAPKERA